MPEGMNNLRESITWQSLVTVTNPATVRILIILLCMNPAWTCKVEDVEGAFLQETFENGEEIYCEVPDGMEEFY